MSKPKPLVPWIGGKRKLAKHILPFPDHQCYVEPFCGAAALYFLKEPSKVEVINDCNGDLINLYRVVKHHLNELVSQFKWCLISRENWSTLQNTSVESLTDIQRAARFLYLQKLSFGGKVSGQTFGTATTSPPRLNLISLPDDLADAHIRLARTTIEQLDWAKCIEKYDRPGTLFYCDPPYWQVEGYGVPFGWDQYERLRELADSIQGKMIISINKHPDVDKLFEGMNKDEIDYKYTVGKSRSRATEVVYRNWGP